MTLLQKMIADRLNGKAHTREEYEALMAQLHDKTYDEAQLAAWLMAVRILGMSKEETALLTLAMTTKSEGEDTLTSIIDKHSTGGVGDSITLLAVPIVAACGVPVMKLSGKKLGFTGGTIDKLLAIPGMNVSKTPAQIRAQMAEAGAYIGMQTDDLCFADKIIYAMRDRTETVASIPLICSSILSKKFSTGAERLVINLKYGSGAFIATADEAQQLAEYMRYACKKNHIPVKIVLEETDQPIANHIGTGLEVQTVVRMLNGDESTLQAEQHLLEVSLRIAREMLTMVQDIDLEAAGQKCWEVLHSGAAATVFARMVAAQGGDLPALMQQRAASQKDVVAARSGRIDRIATAKLGQLINDYAVQADGSIDPLFGVEIHRQRGALVEAGTPILTIHYNEGTAAHIDACAAAMADCYEIG